MAPSSLLFFLLSSVSGTVVLWMVTSWMMMLLVTVTVDGFSTNGDFLRNGLRVGVTAGTSIAPATTTTTTLRALIYGWDDYDDDDGNNNNNRSKKDGGTGTGTGTTTGTTPYETMGGSTGGATPLSFFGSAVAAAECSTAGMYIAEHLTSDRDRVGSLAKLAFYFRGPEHSNLRLHDIESVHVLCVREDTMELEAILCENQGCVSLHIPIHFPTSCTTTLDGPSSDQFQACVLQNMDQLETVVTTVIPASSSSSLQATGAKSSGGTVEMKLRDGTTPNNDGGAGAAWALAMSTPAMDKSSLPSWWVSSTDDELQDECVTMKEILNEDEFVTDLIALAQDGLRHAHQPNVQVIAARCGAVGPAGIGLKVLAKTNISNPNSSQDNDDDDGSKTVIMDVLYPFGGSPAMTVRSLRAAVLGAVAVAAEQQQAVAATTATAASTTTSSTDSGSSMTTGSTTTTATNSPPATSTNRPDQPPQPGNPPYW